MARRAALPGQLNEPIQPAMAQNKGVITVSQPGK